MLSQIERVEMFAVWLRVNSFTTEKINCIFSFAENTVPLQDEVTVQLLSRKKCGQCRSEIRLHVLILIYTVHYSSLCRQQ